MPAPLPDPLLGALLEAAGRLARAGVPWLLAGSAGRALTGYAAHAADLDLEVAGEDVGAAAAALGLTAERTAAGGRSSLRAIGRLEGAEVDLTADLEVRGPGGLLEPDFALQRRFAHPAEAAGRPVAVAPVEEALARAMVLDDLERIARIAREGAGAGRPPLRAGYLARRLSAAARAAR